MSGPGWYPGPDGGYRWWDGNVWTDYWCEHGELEGPRHVMHLLITLVTCGLWLIPWLIIAAGNQKRVEHVQPHIRPLPYRVSSADRLIQDYNERVPEGD